MISDDSSFVFLLLEHPRRRLIITQARYCLCFRAPGSAIEPLPSNTLSEALGISLRTLHRKKGAQSETLSVAQGGRAFKFAEVVAKATMVLGSREAAVQWLRSPAIGLDQQKQKPIDLLATPVGTQLVEELLDRIEYGVYA